LLPEQQALKNRLILAGWTVNPLENFIEEKTDAKDIRRRRVDAGVLLPRARGGDT
jgi:hypothetical protein